MIARLACRVEARRVDVASENCPPPSRSRGTTARQPRRLSALEVGDYSPGSASNSEDHRCFLANARPDADFRSPFEFGCTASVDKGDIYFQASRFPFGRGLNATRIVSSQSFAQVVSQTCIETVWIDFALKNVDAEERCHHVGLPSRSSPR